MAKKVKSNKTKSMEIKDLINQLNIEIKNFDQELAYFKEDLNKIQNSSYWSSKRADSWISSAMQHYESNKALMSKVSKTLNSFSNTK